jgi:hypothetical protein
MWDLMGRKYDRLFARCSVEKATVRPVYFDSVIGEPTQTSNRIFDFFPDHFTEIELLSLRNLKSLVVDFIDKGNWQEAEFRDGGEVLVL